MPRHAILPILLLLGLTGTPGGAEAQQQQRPDQPANDIQEFKADDPAAKKAAERLLGFWEKKSQQIRTLKAEFSREDKDRTFGKLTSYRGRAYLEAPNRAALKFWVIGKDDQGKSKLTEHEKIVCDGRQVFDYRYAQKQVQVYPLPQDRQGRVLDEGPLPFLFNMNAKQAMRQYTWALRQVHVDPATKKKTLAIIQLTPRKGGVERRDFLTAYIYLDLTRFVPTKLHLVDLNGEDTKTYYFKPEAIKGNEPIDTAFFRGDVPNGWERIDNPHEGQAQAPQIGASRPVSAPNTGRTQPRPGQPQLRRRP